MGSLVNRGNVLLAVAKIVPGHLIAVVEGITHHLTSLDGGHDQVSDNYISGYYS